MKKAITISVMLLSIMAGCGGEQSTESLITVDVTKSYPEKELILQDFMDVEYIPLETSDEFITKGKLMDVGKDIIAVSNMREGDILIFDRATGKSLKKINHSGQGPEEYIIPFNILLNKDRNEMFVNDGPSSKIQMYDLDGNYKKTIPYKQGSIIANIYDYNEDYFLSQDVYMPGNESSAHTFFLLSKQDGSMKRIEIPYAKRISTEITKQVGDMIHGDGPRNCLIVPFQNNWILTEPSADTVYMSLPDNSLRPFIVRTPSVHTMNPEVFLFPGVLTDRYYFMQTVKKEYDFEKNEGLPTTNLVYDRQEKAIYKYTVHNGDFSERTEDMSLRSINNEIVWSQTLQAHELVEANEKGQLKGRLKEIAAKLNEEDNPVIMLVKQKK